MVDFVGIRPKTVDGVWHLQPAPNPLDRAEFEKIRAGIPVHVSVVFKRSLEHLRWYRALVGVAAEGIGMHPDALHAELKFRAELVEQILLGQGGRPFIKLQSTAFRSMDEIKFTEYRVIAVNVLFRDFLPGVRRKDIWRRVEELVGPCPW